MRMVLSKTGRYVAKLTLQIVPSVTASVLGGYLLAQIHVGKDASTEPEAARVTGISAKANQSDAPPAVVKPVAAAVPVQRPKPVEKVAEKPAEKPPEKIAEKPAEKPAKSKTNVAALSPRPAEPYQPVPFEPEAEPSTQTLYVAPSAQALAGPSLTTQPIPQSRPQPQAQQPMQAALKMPPQPSVVANAAPAQSALPLPPPTTLSPVNVVASAPPRAPEESTEIVVQPKQRAGEELREGNRQENREEHRGVFSSISSAAGTAANVTGDTINWVFDLPGKLIGRGDAPQQQSGAPDQPQPRRLM